MDISLRVIILVVLVAMVGVVLANGEEPIELTKEESLELINLAFLARAAQADYEEAERVLVSSNQQFKSALRRILEAKSVSLETHNLDLRSGMLTLKEEAREESTP